MNQTVEAGKTFLVDGPASVQVVSGKTETLGFTPKHSSSIVVREGKRLPFLVTETAHFEISLGKNASVEEVECNTIPPSWIASANAIRDSQKKPKLVMVVGKADSGKTSFCTYLINRLVAAKWKAAILDGDLGQSDIGPPCTIAYAHVHRPLAGMYEIKLKNAFFVGVTSPSYAMNKTIEGMVLMKGEVCGIRADFVVVNTDGWVEGEDAVRYKLQLIDAVEPDCIVCIQQKSELEPLLAVLGKYNTIAVQSSSAVKQRSIEKRKDLRERAYARYLKDAKVKAFPLNQLAVEEKISFPAKQGENRGLLLGLYAAHGNFLGIGVLREVDSMRKTLKILTSVSAKPSRVVIGEVRLDENLKEA